MGRPVEILPGDDGPQVTLNGRALYGRSPRQSAIRRVRALSLQPGTVILWPSPLAWLGADELLQELPANCMVIGLELHPELKALTRDYYARTIADPRVVCATEDGRALFSLYRTRGQSRFRRVTELSTSASARLHRETYASVRDSIERDLARFWRNRMTLVAFGRLWIRNLILNLPELRSTVPLPEYNSRPVVVCGAGPSLDRSFDLLFRHRSRYSLVAVDTALVPLLKHGIVPDLTVALDAQLANVLDFLGTPQVPILADITAHPAIFQAQPAGTLSVTEFAPFSLLRRIQSMAPALRPMPPLGSVGVAAARVAAMNPRSPLIFAGLDFAVQRGRTHCGGTSASIHYHARSTRLRPPEDPAYSRAMVDTRIGSVALRSTPVLLGYADSLSEELGPHREVYVLNRTGHPLGARPLDAAGFAELMASYPSNIDARAVREVQTNQLVDGVPVDELIRFCRQEAAELSEFDPTRRTPGWTQTFDYLVALVPDLIRTLDDGVLIDEDALDTNRLLRARLAAAREQVLLYWKTTIERLERLNAIQTA